MKVVKKFPAEMPESWANDASLYIVSRSIKYGMLVLSSASIFIGFKGIWGDTIDKLPVVLSMFIYLTMFFCLALIPDLGNMRLIKFLVSVWYRKKEHQLFEYWDKVLIVAAVPLMIGLTAYSFYMSKITGHSAIDGTVKNAKTVNVEELESKRRAEILTAMTAYNSEREAVQDRFKALNDGDQESIKKLDETKKPSNATYISMQQAKIRKALNERAAQYESKFSDLSKSLDVNKTEINTRYDNLIKKASTGNDRKEKNRFKVVSVLQVWIGGILGYSVLIGLLFSGIEKVIECRNGVEEVVIYSQKDIGISSVKEVLFKPFQQLERKLLNNSRKWVLPTLEKPEELPPIWEQAAQTIYRNSSTPETINSTFKTDNGKKPIGQPKAGKAEPQVMQ